MEVYSEESAHATREAEKPHDVLSESWRPRGESGVELRPACEGWTTRDAGGLSASVKAGEEGMRCPNSSRQAVRLGKQGGE